MINVKNETLVKAIGFKIRTLRMQKNMSQKDLAIEADIEVSQIGRIERGENNPTISTLAVLADALDISLKELVDVRL